MSGKARPGRLRRATAALACGVVILSALTACDDSTARSEQSARASVAIDQASARAVLYLNNPLGYDDPRLMHGTVVVVGADGSFQTVATDGISVGSVVTVGDRIYGSDAHADFAIEAGRLTWRQRDDEQLLQGDIAVVGDVPVMVFNSGVRDGQYWQDLAGWGRTGMLRGSVPGEPTATASCGRAAYALTLPWGESGTAAELYRLTAATDRLVVEKVVRLDLPTTEGLETLECVGDRPWAVSEASGQRIADLGAAGTAGWAPTWEKVAGPPLTGHRCGATRRDVVMLDYEHGGRLLSLNPRTHRTRSIAVVPGAGWSCRSSAEGTMVVSTGDGPDPVIRWYDLDGRQTDELTVTGLGAYLAKSREDVWGRPASLP